MAAHINISTSNLNALNHQYITLEKTRKYTVVASLEDVTLHLVVAVLGSEVNLSSTHHLDVSLLLCGSLSRHSVSLFFFFFAEISLRAREARKLLSRDGDS